MRIQRWCNWTALYRMANILFANVKYKQEATLDSGTMTPDDPERILNRAAAMASGENGCFSFPRIPVAPLVCLEHQNVARRARQPGQRAQPQGLGVQARVLREMDPQPAAEVGLLPEPEPGLAERGVGGRQSQCDGPAG